MEIQGLIERANQGDPGATQELFAALYQELHAMAESQVRRAGSGATLGTTTLLHETYLRLAGLEGPRFPDRSRFMAYASKAMRGLLIDYVRRRQAQKRGGEFEITAIGDSEPGPVGGGDELERLNLGLEELAALDPALAQLVDLHFFCGFTFVEIAAMRGVTDRTVQQHWRKARMVLGHILTEPD